MSKMSQLHAELEEQANELGFENLHEALANGYEVDYEERKLVNPYVLDLDKEQEKAHETWVKEKEKVLEDLDYLLRGYPYPIEDAEKVANAIDFIKKGEV